MVNRILVAFILICIFGAVTSAIISRSTENSAPLLIEQNNYSFGDVRQKTQLKKTFRLTNQSSTPIVFSNIHAECSCTVPAMKKKRLSPSESTELDVVWDVGSSRGPINTNIELSYKTLTPESGFLETLVLNTRVIPDFEYAPSRLEFSPSDVLEAEVEFTPSNMKRLEIDSVYCTHSAFEAELHKNENGVSTVSVKFNPEKWFSDSLNAQLIVASNSNGEPRTSIPLIVSDVKHNQERGD